MLDKLPPNYVNHEVIDLLVTSFLIKEDLGFLTSCLRSSSGEMKHLDVPFVC